MRTCLPHGLALHHILLLPSHPAPRTQGPSIEHAQAPTPPTSRTGTHSSDITHRHPPLQHHAQAPTRMMCVCYCQGPMMGPTLLPPGRGPPRSPLYRAQVRATATARPHHSPGKGEGEAQAGSPRRSRLWPPSLHHPASKLPGLHLGVCRLCATWLEGRNTSGCAISALCRHLAKPSGLLGAGFLAQLQRSSSTHKAPQG